VSLRIALTPNCTVHYCHAFRGASADCVHTVLYATAITLQPLLLQVAQLLSGDANAPARRGALETLSKKAVARNQRARSTTATASSANSNTANSSSRHATGQLQGGVTGAVTAGGVTAQQRPRGLQGSAALGKCTFLKLLAATFLYIR
jgi:hypothetical protein